MTEKVWRSDRVAARANEGIKQNDARKRAVENQFKGAEIFSAHFDKNGHQGKEKGGRKHPKGFHLNHRIGFYVNRRYLGYLKRCT